MTSRRSIIRIAIVAITPLVCFGLLKAGVVATQTRPGARAAGGEDARRTPMAATMTAARPAKGYPRDYHAGINVSTYSLANTASGNLLTVIPITSWSGRGPAMDFNLYHNSEDGVWGTSYGAHIDIISSAEVHVVTDDGMEITFTKFHGIWRPEPGFHSTLVQLQPPSVEWTWTLKDQTVYKFNNDELLISIADAAGNKLTVNHDGFDRIASVTDAPGRALNFTYSGYPSS